MPKLFTIGHSIHKINEFIDILMAYQITMLVDVRKIPHSSYVPWFNKAALKRSLEKNSIAYRHEPLLGGLRRPQPNTMNIGWKNTGFRGFADYMQTPEFFQALKELILLMKNNKNVAIMCSEALPWRCHRSLIADALIIRHFKVFDIINKSSLRLHKLTSFAVVKKNSRPLKVYYPKDT